MSSFETILAWALRCLQAMKLLALNQLKMLLFFCFLVFLITSCGKNRAKDANNSSNARWNNFPVEIYVDTAVINDSAAQKDLKDAMQFWEDKTKKHLFHIQGSWNGGFPVEGSLENPDFLRANVLYLMSPWPFAPTAAGNTILLSDEGWIQNSVIFINTEKTYCASDCPGQTKEISRRKLFAHELGHFLGLGHVSQSGNIMSPSIEYGGDLSTVDVDISALRSVID